MNRYTIEYTNSNRKKLNRQFKDVNHFIQEFEVDESMMKAFLKVAEDEKVEWNEEQFLHSENLIKYQVKGLIARNLWDMDAYYQVIVPIDETLQAAMKRMEYPDLFSDMAVPSILDHINIKGH